MAIKNRKRTIDLGTVNTTSEIVGAESYDEAFAICTGAVTCVIEGSNDGGTTWETLPGTAIGNAFHATFLTPLIRVVTNLSGDVDLCLHRDI